MDAEHETALPGISLLYDASRIVTRILTPTPNGIDRLDALLCGELLGEADLNPAALVFGWRGPRLLEAGEGLAALHRAERMWGEHERAHAGHTALPDIKAWLRDPSRAQAPRVVERRRGRIGAALTALRRTGLRRGRDPVRHAPVGAVYVNATHFPLDWPSHVAWLERRRDIRLVPLVHDLLPIDRPDLFWAGETERHRRRLALLAQRGAGALVTTKAVADRLRGEMERAGRPDLPILAAPPPVAPIFRAPPVADPDLAGISYFVACGTIEPRKNHALLLRVWRRLVAERGARAPKLVIIGKRGWLCDTIVAEIGAPALAGFVIEVSSLTSGDYKILLENARALLAPSLAEGFGLPVAEALATGTKVIASDIAPFQEQQTDGVTLIGLDPRSETLWYDAIASHADAARSPATAKVQHAPVTPDRYLRQVRDFFDRCL